METDRSNSKGKITRSVQTTLHRDIVRFAKATMDRRLGATSLLPAVEAFVAPVQRIGTKIVSSSVPIRIALSAVTQCR